jgi:hypothetical protein
MVDNSREQVLSEAILGVREPLFSVVIELDYCSTRPGVSINMMAVRSPADSGRMAKPPAMHNYLAKLVAREGESG